MQAEQNWAGNHIFRAQSIYQPKTIDEARHIVAASAHIRGLGTRHTFNDLPDSTELISLANIDPGISIDPESMTASVNAGVKYGIFAEALNNAGFALKNMGSLPHISVSGATATGTHGSGDRNGNLSTAVQGIDLITGNGEILHVERGDPRFDGMVVHLGALGIVARLTFDIEPTYLVCQEVLEDLPWDALTENFDEVFGSAYSVSVFTMFAGDNAGVLWRKHRMDEGWVAPPSGAWSTTPSRAQRHPVAELSGAACTPQLLEPGPWCYRLPHFRLDQVPASGSEIQTEYMVKRSLARDVIAALRAFEPEFRELLIVSEIRTIAADSMWLSTAYGEDTVAFHFSWYLNQVQVDSLLPALERVLAPFSPRPHWGKAFSMDAKQIRGAYPRFSDFRKLRKQMDPVGKFSNSFLQRCGLSEDES